MALACVRAWGLCVRPAVELVWFAEPAYSTDSGAALLGGDEATIVSTVADIINSAPFIGISGSHTGCEED